MKFDIYNKINGKGKICTRELFDAAIDSERVRTLCDKIARGELELKRQLPAVTWQAWFDDGKRKNVLAHPSGLFMLDIDHVDFPDAHYRKWEETFHKPLGETLGVVAIHMTPSTQGIRFVAKCRPEFSTIAENQQWLARKLMTRYDEVTKDFARLSFLVPRDYFFYLDPSLFEDDDDVTILINNDYETTTHNDSTNSNVSNSDCTDTNVQPMDNNDVPALDGRKEQQPDSSASSVLPAGSVGGNLFEGDRNCYRNTPLHDIALLWLKSTGGEPVQGERNTRLFQLATRMRYITEFDAQLIADNIPHYGLSDAEVLAICKSACSERRNGSIPRDLQVVIKQLSNKDTEDVQTTDDDDNEITEEEMKANDDEAEENTPLPELPPIFKEYADIAPQDFKQAVVLTLLPIVGTLAGTIRSEYNDGTLHAPSFQCAVEAPQASGKSYARFLVDQLMSKLKEQDSINRQKEQAWKEECKVKKNAKELPKEPQSIIRYLPGKISIATLLKRLDRSHGLFVFSYCDEVDTLRKSWSAGEFSNFSDIMRIAFDGGEYGQDYMSENSYSAIVKVHYNTLHCGTPKAMRRFYNNSEDGSVSRVIFIELPDQFGKKMPKWERMKASVKARVDNIIDRISEYDIDPETNLASTVTLKLPKLRNAMRRWVEAQQKQAVNESDRTRDVFCRRAAVVGFRAGMLAAYLWNDKKHDKQVNEFAEWVANHMLNQLLERFEIKNESNTILYAPLYRKLSNVFTREELDSVKQKIGYTTPAKIILYRWTQKGNITKSTKGNYYIKK